MSKIIEQQFLTGERALFGANDLTIRYTTFADGESPLKESADIALSHSMFKWKYPLWYSKNITLEHCTLFDMARAGIWYTHHISLNDCTVDAPKNFRRATDVTLKDVTFPNAEETLWSCDGVRMDHVTAKGSYFGMNSTNLTIQDFDLSGNYPFDGGKNIEIHNARMLSKDAFWNCDNVTVTDSFLSGEYLGWNSKNITFINCTIESLQGFCYMQNVVLKNCRLLNTNLAFEYSTVDAEVLSSIDSVKNPISGRITAKSFGEIIFDDPEIQRDKTVLTTTGSANT
jgi:hypothetical protein